ncbi:MYOSIN-LIKE PROTEIN [Salix purpurea]|uniref:MYOSIN-LIKE PROTEIN n=1 Tax=Salix purpurea TaxID=77065 RepID=A0A9Q0VUT1_SALPP|nr:MYOSIN-LIKE PROTEIN [Salix purpurea]
MDKVSTITTLTSRRPKWQYPPPQPTPRILHLPRRPRRKQVPKSSAAKPSSVKDKKGRLEVLFDQERGFARGVMPIVMVGGIGGDQYLEEERRERVEERESVVMEEEKWRFQAEMLRAECNLLRMEREIAVKKMERRRVQMERILRYAVRTLLSVRKGICDGRDMRMVLDEEIQELIEKLERLQRRSGVKDSEGRKCSNLDRQVSILRRRLEKFGGESDEICVKEIQEMAEASLSIKTNCSVHETFASDHSCNQMEMLRRKMEGLSNGSLVERMEDEYGSMLSTANSSATNSASTSKRLEFPDMPSSSTRQSCKEAKSSEEKACSGRCKVIVRRVIEQVRAETEQWSQMQGMLRQVRKEMEELQASRDFWEDRALDSDCEIQSLNSAVEEWRQKALSSEAKGNELQNQVDVLQGELERLRKARSKETSRSKNLPPNETEKRVLVCRLKENCNASDDCRKQKAAVSDGRRKPHAGTTSGLNAPKRSPFRDIGNSSPLARQNIKAVFPLHYPVQENYNF